MCVLRTRFLSMAVVLFLVSCTQSPITRWFSSALAEEEKLPSLEINLPSMRYEAHYAVYTRDVLVGTAIAQQKDLYEPGPLKFEMKLANRIGSSPVAIILDNELDSSSGEKKYMGKLQLLGREGPVLNSLVTWKKSDKSLVLSGGDTSYLKSLFYEKEKVTTPVSSQVWDENSSLLFFKPRKISEKNIKMFFPHTGESFGADEIKAKFDEDGFIKTAFVPWAGGMVFEFRRVTENEQQSNLEKMKHNFLDLAWFTVPKNESEDLKDLRETANNVYTKTRSLEVQINKETPDVPYILHRRVYNLSRFAKKTSYCLSSLVDTDKVLSCLEKNSLFILAEHKEELPQALVNTPELEVLKDPTKKWQWPKLIGYLLNKAVRETEQIVVLEKVQKVGVSIRVTLDKMARRSVVKAKLQPRTIAVKLQFERAPEDNMDENSWTSLPLLITQSRLASSGKVPAAGNIEVADKTFRLINGQAFAQGKFGDLKSVCAAFQGRVGIDLGDAPQAVFRSDMVRGIWDTATRLDLAREFSRRAVASPGCLNISIQGPKKLEERISAELDTFRKSILQVETSFQVSNGSGKKIRLVPGTYELTLSSLLTGDIFAKRDIDVPDGKDARLNLRVR